MWLCKIFNAYKLELHPEVLTDEMVYLNLLLNTPEKKRGWEGGYIRILSKTETTQFIVMKNLTQRIIDRVGERQREPKLSEK